MWKLCFFSKQHMIKLRVSGNQEGILQAASHRRTAHHSSPNSTHQNQEPAIMFVSQAAQSNCSKHVTLNKVRKRLVRSRSSV